MDWALWFYWIIATTSGWLIGSTLFRGIPIVISGVLIAAMQWAVLYKRIDKSWQWFILSSFTWIISLILLVLFFPGAENLYGPFLGFALGLTQWLILRRELEWTGWWIVISALGWTTGLTLMPGLFTTGALPGALTGLALVIFFRYSEDLDEGTEVNDEIQSAGK